VPGHMCQLFDAGTDSDVPRAVLSVQELAFGVRGALGDCECSGVQQGSEGDEVPGWDC
jgi:hypothetical protein